MYLQLRGDVRPMYAHTRQKQSLFFLNTPPPGAQVALFLLCMFMYVGVVSGRSRAQNVMRRGRIYIVSGPWVLVKCLSRGVNTASRTLVACVEPTRGRVWSPFSTRHTTARGASQEDSNTMFGAHL